MMIRQIPLLLLFVSNMGFWAQDQVFTGKLDAQTPYGEHTIQLSAGQIIVAQVEATNGDLFPYVSLYNDADERIASSINRSDPESALVYRVARDGAYALAVSSVDAEASNGFYRLRVQTGDKAILDRVTAASRLELSGPLLTQDTPHFRVHYTLRGADVTSERYAAEVAKALETTWAVQIEQMGWPAPPPDLLGGDGRYDVYIANLKDRDGLVMGYISNEMLIGDNPNSDPIEEWAASSFMVIENDFAEVVAVDEDPIELMRVTVAHEFSHAVQMGYDASELLDWYYEATAVWMEIATFDLGLSAIQYIEDNYYYPEVCFGSLQENGGVGLDYGDWVFIQSLVDQHGPGIVQALWRNIADYEGFETLERTLAAYDDRLTDAMVRHHLQTLTRSYPAIEQSEAVLWLANSIRDLGDWTPEDPGVQELGANFFYLKRPPGRYDVRLENASRNLGLWSVGIRGDQAEVAPLGQGGTVTTEGYDYVYLMVFNSAYDDNVNNCQYAAYSLNVMAGSGQPVAPTLTLDATHFLPLKVR